MTEPVPPAPPAPRERLLVAIDFSPASECALEHALRLAEALDADVVALHVVHGPAADPAFYARDDEGRRHRSGNRTLVMTGGDMLERFIARARDAASAPSRFDRLSTRHVTGTPSTRIVEVARELGASQIIMGSRGRAGWKGILLGSTAQRVIQLAPMPITLVKAGAEAVPPSHPGEDA